MVVSKGNAEEKIEGIFSVKLNEIASKSLAHMYQTFKKDIPNPMEDILIKQIDAANTDQNETVRAELSILLSSYSIVNAPILLHLIACLNDSSEFVKSSAIQALQRLGICSKQALETTMVQLGMKVKANPFKPVTEASYLDVIFIMIYRIVFII